MDVVRVQSVVDLNAYGGMQLQDVFNLVARPVAPVLTPIGDQSQPSTTAPGMSEKNTISQQAPDFVLPPTTNEQPAASTSASYSSRQTLPLPPTGLWVIPGMINHSCLPNVTRTFVGDVVFVRAACGLPAGQAGSGCTYGRQAQHIC